MNNGKFFAGLALGALVGSALSCFAHSNRGRKLRRDVYDAIQDLQEDAKDLAHHAKHKAEQVSSDEGFREYRPRQIRHNNLLCLPDKFSLSFYIKF